MQATPHDLPSDGQPVSHRSNRRWLRWIGLVLLVSYFILGALFLIVRDVIWKDLGRWQPQVERLLASYTGHQVQVKGLRGDFIGFSPVVTADSIQVIRDNGEALFSASKVSAGLNWRTVVRWTPVLDILTSSKLTMRIERTSESQVEIVGRPFNLPNTAPLQRLQQAGSDRGPRRWQLPEWFMARQGFRLDDVEIDYRDLQTGARLSALGMSMQSFERDGQRSLLVDMPHFSNQKGAIQIRATLGRSAPASERVPNASGAAHWHGEAWAKVTAFDSSQLAALLRRPPLLRQGEFGAQAWFTLARSAPANARLLIEGTDVALLAEQTEARFQSLDVQVDALWAENGDMELTVSRAQATDIDGNQIAIDDNSHTATLDAALQPVQARFSLQAFDARRFHQFAMGLPIPADLRNQFASLSLTGKVARLGMEYDSRDGPTRYNIDAQFEQLSIADNSRKGRPDPTNWAPQLPSAENISGTVQFSERQGLARLHGTDAAISFPGVFAKPRISLDTVQAELTWQVGAARLPADAAGNRRPDVAVQINKLVFSNDDAEGDVTGAFQTVPVGPGRLDLSGRLTRANASQVYRYLPLKMPGEVRNWMKESFVAGISDDVRFELNGDLWDFPFRRRGSGDFLIDAFVKGATFRYAPDWPAINGMRARVRIRRGGLEVISREGNILGVALRNTRADIADFRKAVLKLKGTAVGSAQRMIQYVNRSPIGKRIDGFTTRTRISGSATTQLSLTLPFHNFDEFKVSGSTQLNGSKVLLTDFLPLLTKVRGTLLFSEKGIGIRKMKAVALGGALKASAQSPRRGLTEIRLTGRASAAGLRQFNDNILTRGIRGKTGYAATIRMDRGIPSVTVTTGLTGLQVQLPPPMYKHAGVTLPMTIRLRPLGDTTNGVRADELTVSIPKDRIEAVIRRKRNGRGLMRVARGVLSIGAKGAPLLPATGLKVAVSGIPVNADRWIDFWSGDQRVHRGNEPSEASALAGEGYFAGFNLVPSEITLVVPSARFLSKRFHDVVVGATRDKRRWKVNLLTREANGYVSFRGADRAADAVLVARFKHLDIPRDEVTTFERIFSDVPAPLPAMDIWADQFRLRGRPMGRLRLRAANRADQWLIDELSLSQPSARFAATGSWRPGQLVGTGTTMLDFDLDISDAGLLLTDLGMPRTVRGGPGKLSGDIQWTGSPFAPHMQSLDGRIDIALGRGQFLRTEPGMAKLIGVLSLQALPRRLSLDFSDVIENGFAFDAIIGRADITKGTVKTDSLLMHGIQAEVLIAGSADIPKETQALSVKVAPTINAGIASLAYAALANPAVGFGTLLAQIILDKPLREIFSHEFHVTGSWDAPTVTQVQRYEDESLEPGSAYSPG